MPNRTRTFLIFIGLYCLNAFFIGCIKTKSIQEKTKGLLLIKESMYNDHSPLEIADPTHQSIKYSVRLTLLSEFKYIL